MPKGCLVFMAIIFARLAGRQRGTWIWLLSLARRAPSERRSAPALPSPSRSLPPLSPTCFFTHLTSSLPGRARERAGVLTRRDSQGPPRRQGQAGSPRASLRPPRHLYPGPVGPLPACPAPPGSNPAHLPESFFLFVDFFPLQSPRPLPPVPTRTARTERQPRAERGPRS